MRYLIVLAFICSSFFANAQTKHPDGPFKEFHSNAQLKREGYYKNDKKINVWKEYYDNGQLSEVYVLDDTGKNTGLKREYSKEGVLLKETKNVLDGGLVCSEYDNEGTLLAIYGLREQNNLGRFVWSGDYKEFYKNGVVKIESVYDNNELNGIWKAFDEVGNLAWEVEYLNGYKQGAYKQFYENEEVKLLGLCNSDKKDDEEKHFDTSGKLLKVLKYKRGELKKTKDQEVIEEVLIPEGIVYKQPLFPGCEDALGFSAQNKCNYDHISGFFKSHFNIGKFDVLAPGYETKKIKVNISFRISESGDVNTVRATSDYPKVDEDAIEAIKKLPKFEPGVKRGNPLTVPYSFQFVFLAGGNSK
ncbi:energy transducer TonB [Mariniflexile sp. HNIBRBA6329]|uniref:energy transducer TonB n=1 Tax=Mariniflexile sp. HNIBRBA6329 TaxID=3373088 RepID=UPI0037473AAE